MQFKISQVMIFITCFACVMAIRDLSVFRQGVGLLATVSGAWIAGAIAIAAGSKRAWQWGALAGIFLTFVWYLIVYLTWPALVAKNLGINFSIPLEFFVREVAFLVAFSAIAGACVGGWVTVADQEELKKDFAVAVLMSKLILLAVVVFRLLKLVGDMRPDWGTLSLFCALVFVIHTFSWLPRLYRHWDGSQQPSMRRKNEAEPLVSSED
jgi:hypothetical protein